MLRQAIPMQVAEDHANIAQKIEDDVDQLLHLGKTIRNEVEVCLFLAFEQKMLN
jgi:hypothetical protein